MSFGDFMKTSLFRFIVMGSVLVIFVVSVLVCGVCFYKKRVQRALYRVEKLEGSLG